MASSLSAECTPLKTTYDACFNSWFEGYLEPAVATSAAHRSEYSKRKAEEYQQKCGKIWEEYKACVQKAIKDNGLETVLQQARDEHPLASPAAGQQSPSSK
ncbi:mitochondrial distribution/morphology family 35/apoptosis [Ephemerocybe angulata]|uniref:Mitochondrial distribution/morphology family 35/apoptosis n=1 Tax=Ephemerocybe angulata TaxID=980116 RepID=A0A8H6MDV8_9AGAR|nr:mitochondrial distribution/morphology family 35/apoptosis [Tulosesus angulatus]